MLSYRSSDSLRLQLDLDLTMIKGIVQGIFIVGNHHICYEVCKTCFRNLHPYIRREMNCVDFTFAKTDSYNVIMPGH